MHDIYEILRHSKEECKTDTTDTYLQYQSKRLYITGNENLQANWRNIIYRFFTVYVMIAFTITKHCFGQSLIP